MRLPCCAWRFSSQSRRRCPATTAVRARHFSFPARAAPRTRYQPRIPCQCRQTRQYPAAAPSGRRPSRCDRANRHSAAWPSYGRRAAIERHRFGHGISASDLNGGLGFGMARFLQWAWPPPSGGRDGGFDNRFIDQVWRWKSTARLFDASIWAAFAPRPVPCARPPCRPARGKNHSNCPRVCRSGLVVRSTDMDGAGNPKPSGVLQAPTAPA